MTTTGRPGTAAGRFRRTAWVSAVVVAATTAAPSALAVDEAPEERWVVVAEDGPATDAVVDELATLGAVPEAAVDGVLDAVAATLDESEAAALREVDGVVAVERARTYSVDALPLGAAARVAARQVDPVWNLDRIDQRSPRLDGVYRYPDSAGSGVRVYVVDTGLAPGHPELSGRVSRGFGVDGGGTEDCHGHGTHVAGTVASTTYGVAKHAVVVPVRVFGCYDEDATTVELLEGLDWILDHHPAGRPGVVNVSLSGEADPVLDAALERLVAEGLVVTVAAGNEGVDACRVSPARVPAVITVGATEHGGRSDRRLGGTNVGRCLDAFAPGAAILSLGRDRGYVVEADGTSMAAPHAAGLAALFLAERPDANPAQVRAALLRAAVPGVTSRGSGSPDRLLTVPVAVPERTKSRLAGDDRYATAAAVADEAFPTSRELVLVAGAQQSLVDGLVAAPFAVHRGAPVLLAERTRLGAVTRAEVTERRPRLVWLVGGRGVLADGVARELRSLGVTDIRRLAGGDRYATAAAVARQMPRGGGAVVASGAPANLVDAAAVSGPAAADGRPVLLTDPRSLTRVTRQTLTDRRMTKVRVVGGTGAVSRDVERTLRDRMGLAVHRLGGSDRYATSAAIASGFLEATGAERVVVTGGADANLVDAVTGGVLQEPTLLTARSPSAVTRDWIVGHDVRHVVAVGGTGSVPFRTLETLRALP